MIANAALCFLHTRKKKFEIVEPTYFKWYKYWVSIKSRYTHIQLYLVAVSPSGDTTNLVMFQFIKNLIFIELDTFVGYGEVRLLSTLRN